MDEKSAAQETMRRENRRLAAMSWGSCDEVPAPPKPSRYPALSKCIRIYLEEIFIFLPYKRFLYYFLDADSTSLSSLSSIDAGAPQTYIVAQNPEVLAHLMKENENRGFCPAAYTTPASVFNTVAVDFEKKDETPEPILKTIPMPVQSLHKLDPEVNITDAVTQQPTAMIDTQMKQQKVGTLERTPSKTSSSSGTPKMGSLERNSNKSGNNSPKMNTLERTSTTSSIEKAGMFSPKLGSLERKSPKMGSLERNTHIQNSGTFSPKMCSSLERHTHIYQSAKVIDFEQIPNYHPEPVSYHFQTQKTEIEENIYDFGGIDVKSCAHKQPNLMIQKFGQQIHVQQQQQHQHLQYQQHTVDNKSQEVKVRNQA